MNAGSISTVLTRLFVSCCLAALLQACGTTNQSLAPILERAVADAVPTDDLWVRLRTGFSIPLVDKHQFFAPELERYRDDPEFLMRATRRARYFLYHIVSELESRGLPVELALIPAVENGYQPFALSPNSGAGIWELEPSTARALGLEIEWWYDGRRDILDSTDAALNRLETLNATFAGDWVLTVAAFHSSVERVRAASERSAETKRSSSLLLLPLETQSYIARWLAVIAIVADPERAGLTLGHLSNRPYFTAVDIESLLDLSVAAQVAELPLEQILFLNAGFSRWATSPNRHRILVPQNVAREFAERIDNLSPEERLLGGGHEVGPGETLADIAKRYRTFRHYRASDFARMLMLPPGSALLRPETLGSPAYATHTVSPGESLWLIAKRHGVSMSDLEEWNDIRREAVIHPGDRLVVGDPKPQLADVEDGNGVGVVSFPDISESSEFSSRYTAREGDTVESIARQHRVSVDSILQWNRFGTGTLLRTGQDVLIPGGLGYDPPEPPIRPIKDPPRPVDPTDRIRL